MHYCSERQGFISTTLRERNSGFDAISDNHEQYNSIENTVQTPENIVRLISLMKIQHIPRLQHPGTLKRPSGLTSEHTYRTFRLRLRCCRSDLEISPHRARQTLFAASPNPQLANAFPSLHPGAIHISGFLDFNGELISVLCDLIEWWRDWEEGVGWMLGMRVG